MNLLDTWSNFPGGDARPLVTFYDLRTDERVELSGTTLRNWVAKGANLLTDAFDAGTGTRVAIGIDTHWMRCVLLLATWAVGAVVVESDADIVLTGPDLDLGRSPGARHRAAASLRPFGAPFASTPDGFVDLGLDLPIQPDVFVNADKPADGDLAVDLAGRRQTRAELVSSVTPSAERLLFTPARLECDIDALVAATLGGGSIVLVTHGASPDLERIAPQERARIA